MNLTEAQTKNSIEDYLKLGVNQGKWEYLRIQSGSILKGYQNKEGTKRFHKIQFAEEGYPDFMVFQKWYPQGAPNKWEAFVNFFEVKSTKGKLTEAQVKMHERLRAQGAYVFVVKTVDEVMRELE